MIARRRVEVMRHRQCPAGLGPYRMIGTVAGREHPILGIGRFVTRRLDPVAQGQMTKAERL